MLMRRRRLDRSHADHRGSADNDESVETESSGGAARGPPANDRQVGLQALGKQGIISKPYNKASELVLGRSRGCVRKKRRDSPGTTELW